jgi:rhodanese-related sulfurtransferase
MPLAPRQLEQKRSEGALLVDVRTDLQFDEAHIPGSIAITTLGAGFGTRLAWLADPDQQIVLIGRDDEDARKAALLAVAVGIRNLGGFLGGGMTSWRAEHRDVGRIERIQVPDLYERWRNHSIRQILDVREQPEWDEGHIAGSVHKPYHDIDRIPAEIDPGQPVAVICSSGRRSVVGASVLRRHGAINVIHVADGGVGTWGELGHSMERSEPAPGTAL